MTGDETGNGTPADQRNDPTVKRGDDREDGKPLTREEGEAAEDYADAENTYSREPGDAGENR